ncbi:hypothetical protein M413DRAFT_443041 [Hebeloma cylindrosporum]|uniref:Terpene synthase n=1 Tax=Hebeloma cylindrosporum TaxID=76867 RepID=A0A0C3CJN0_HEBCY|nr:hypothetical protein M413DRAFT_443041 [Hebeloma cylindrosporum h7]
MTIPHCHSFQLPDLLAIVGSLELRTNPHCRFVTDGYENWISKEPDMLTVNELIYLRSTKLGLLAALCFPTCDVPQLRILTDFIVTMFYSGMRECAPGYSSELSNLKKEEPRGQSSTEESQEQESAVDVLKNQELFKHLFDDHFIHLISKASPSWNFRLSQSVQSFQAARNRFMLNQSKSEIPTLEDYIEMRRELHGITMSFVVAELLEVFQVPELQGAGAETLESLKRCAFDIIAWSMDVVSYRLDQSRGVTQNLVAILMLHKNLSVQGAMNLCGNMVKDSFISFSSFERALLALFDPDGSLKFPVFSWMWKSIMPDASSVEEAETMLKIVKRYIQALKDYIIGIINWVYETELFFGKRGGEIRAFGWVFADQSP